MRVASQAFVFPVSVWPRQTRLVAVCMTRSQLPQSCFVIPWSVAYPSSFLWNNESRGLGRRVYRGTEQVSRFGVIVPCRFPFVVTGVICDLHFRTNFFAVLKDHAGMTGESCLKCKKTMQVGQADRFGCQVKRFFAFGKCVVKKNRRWEGSSHLACSCLSSLGVSPIPVVFAGKRVYRGTEQVSRFAVIVPCRFPFVVTGVAAWFAICMSERILSPS